MASSKHIIGRPTSHWIHGRDRLRRASRSGIRRFQSDVVLSKHLRELELREHHLWHGCISHPVESTTCKRCSHLLKPDCRLQGSYSSSKSGNLASRTLLASSDTKGEKKDRTYCPATWKYAYEYDTPATYSDQLREKGAPSLLSHECVLSVIAQMSNKNQKHAQCAFAHSPSCVLSGLMVSLTPVWKPKVPRSIQLSEPVEFDSIDHMRTVLNGTLSKADDFVEVPPPRTECQI